MAPDDDVAGAPIGMSSVEEALYPLLETELVRAEVYRTATRCTAGDPRAEMFAGPLEEAELHAAIAEGLLESFGLDPAAEAPSRLPIRTLGRALVEGMEQAVALTDERSAWLTVAEAVVTVVLQTERRWTRVERLAALTQGAPGEALREATREISARTQHTVPWSVAHRPQPSRVRDFVLRPPERRTTALHAAHRARSGSRGRSRAS